MQASLTLGEILDLGDLAFGAGLRDAVSFSVGARTFVYFVGGTGGGLTALEVLSDGSLCVIDETPLSSSFAVGTEPRLLIGDIDGTATLIVSGQSGATARSIGLLPDGEFGAVGSLTGDPSALNHPTMVVGPDGTYLIGSSGNGLLSYALDSTGSIALASSLTDGAATYLAAISDLSTARVGGSDFVVAVSATEAALTVLSVGNGGALTRTGEIGAPDGLGVSGLTAVETAYVAGKSFAITAASGTSSLSVIEIGDGGIPVLRDHVVDDLATRFQSVEALAVAEISGRTFVAAGGADDGVSLFALSPAGMLIHLDTFENQIATTISDVSTVELVPSATGLEALVAGLGEPGITRLNVDVSTLGATIAGDDAGGAVSGSALDDLIAGGSAADTIVGGDGNDILLDGGGSDDLTGGAGADLFVLSGDGQSDRILDFEPGTDRLDLSAFPLLYDPSQLTVVTQSWGVRLIWKSETIDLYTSGGGAIDVSGWGPDDILNLDRPQYLPISQLLNGSEAGDTLRGGEGADTIVGLGGVDTIDGEGGDDLIEAGTGNDIVTGGTGQDRLFGQAGFDTIHGGDGADTLWGGNEADSLFGDAGADTLYGENGVDNLFGGNDGDQLYGGQGNDRLYGGGGADNIFGDTEEDRLFGEDGDDQLFGGAGFDRLEGGAGNDTLYGGAQADNLFGNDNDDILFGEGGFDRLFGGSGQDDLEGGDGSDALFGELGHDTLNGGSDDDRLFGGQGNDILSGGAGADTVQGGAGFDTLIGGAGNDILTGNFNADTFVFADGHGDDVITDFEATNSFEKIDLSGVSAIADFADLAANHMAQTGGDVVIGDGASFSLTLMSVSLIDLGADDFLF